MDESKLYYVYRCFNDPANHYWMVKSNRLMPATNVQEHHTFVLRPCENPCGWLERIDRRLYNCIVQKVESSSPEGFQAQVQLSDPLLLSRIMMEDGK